MDPSLARANENGEQVVRMVDWLAELGTVESDRVPPTMKAILDRLLDMNIDHPAMADVVADDAVQTLLEDTERLDDAGRILGLELAIRWRLRDDLSARGSEFMKALKSSLKSYFGYVRDNTSFEIPVDVTTVVHRISSSMSDAEDWLLLILSDMSPLLTRWAMDLHMELARNYDDDAMDDILRMWSDRVELPAPFDLPDTAPDYLDDIRSRVLENLKIAENRGAEYIDEAREYVDAAEDDDFEVYTTQGGGHGYEVGDIQRIGDMDLGDAEDGNNPDYLWLGLLFVDSGEFEVECFDGTRAMLWPGEDIQVWAVLRARPEWGSYNDPEQEVE
jgi:hypothetical protein